jgi:polysaccharide pyruvyl transferase WcaK-like protein
MTAAPPGPKKVAVFGHFGVRNFGNEGTLEAVLHHLRRLLPDAEIVCICSNAPAVAEAYGVQTVQISDTVLTRWRPRSSILRGARRAIVGLPSEPYRWWKTGRVLRDVDLLIFPGTGLLTDINGLLGFGPYSVFKWVSNAKRRGCEVAFLSVGAGPLSSVRGRWFARAALRKAEYRSYRDASTKAILRGIGFEADDDPIYPDLVFSLPVTPVARVDRDGDGRKPVVGIGVMADPEKLAATAGDDGVYAAYLGALSGLARRLDERGYGLRLVIGDVADERAKGDLKALLVQQGHADTAERIVDEPVASAGDVVAQIEATDLMVATRFHNVLLAFVCERPVVAISFHHKCDSLMEAMGRAEDCVELRGLTGDALVAAFDELERHAGAANAAAAAHTSAYREALDEQYRTLFG